MSKFKPIGLTILCSLLAIIKGLLPLWVSILFLNNQQIAQITGVGLGAFALNVLISISVIVTSYLTWTGNVKAKSYLIALIWIGVIGVVLNSLNVLMNPSSLGLDTLNEQQQTTLLANIVRSGFWLVLMHWYFNTAKAREYFGS